MALHTAHTAQLLDGDRVLPLTAVQLTANTDWSPRFEGQATIVQPYDPEPIQYVQLTLTRRVYSGTPISEWTATWGARLEAYTADGVHKLEDGTAKLAGTQSLSLELTARKANSHDLPGTTELVLASCEMDLHDIKLLDYEPREYTTTSLKTLVTQILTATGDGRHLVETIAVDQTIEAPTVWEPGQSAWDVLEPHMNDWGVLLYAENRTDYRLRYRARSTAVDLALTTSNITEFEPTIDVAETYREGNLTIFKSPNNNGIRYEGNGPRGVHRASVVNGTKRLAADSVTHSWDARVDPRRGAQSSTARITAPDRLTIDPDDLVRLVLDSEQQGYVQHVRHTWPDGLMTLDIESLVTL